MIELPTIYIADASADAIVIYADPGGEHARYDVAAINPATWRESLDEVLAGHGWYRVRAWREPHDAPGHLVAQVTLWTMPTNPGRPE